MTVLWKLLYIYLYLHFSSLLLNAKLLNVLFLICIIDQYEMFHFTTGTNTELHCTPSVFIVLTNIESPNSRYGLIMSGPIRSFQKTVALWDFQHTLMPCYGSLTCPHTPKNTHDMKSLLQCNGTAHVFCFGSVSLAWAAVWVQEILPPRCLTDGLCARTCLSSSERAQTLRECVRVYWWERVDMWFIEEWYEGGLRERKIWRGVKRRRYHK